MRKKKQKEFPPNLIKVFYLIAAGLVVVGIARDDFLWFIRAGIFLVAAYLMWLRNKRLRK
jgi:hypothetical protein